MSFKVSHYLLFFLITLTSCEVFKTTPRSARDQSKPNTARQTPPKKTSDRKEERPTLIGNLKKKKDPSQPKTVENRRSTTARNQSSTTSRTARPASSRATPSGRTNTRTLSSRPNGSYEEAVPEIIKIARSFTGTPYRSGGNDRNGIDCSGLICQVYSEMGLKVPRISWQQSEFGQEVERIRDIQPGDWLFFVPEGGKEGYVSHSGIVTEVRSERDIRFIHASSSRGVIEDNLFSTYFRNRFVKAIRPF